MKLEVDDSAVEALEAAIDRHWGGEMDNWEGMMVAVRGLVPNGVRRRVERSEGCAFTEWLDEVLFKWDGRSARAVVELLTAACEKIR